MKNIFTTFLRFKRKIMHLKSKQQIAECIEKFDELTTTNAATKKSIA